jgi:hypothetical protein
VDLESARFAFTDKFMSEKYERTTVTIEIDPDFYEAPASSEKEALERSRRMVISLWPQVFAVMMKGALGGSVPHAKFVFDCWNPPKPNEKPKTKPEAEEQKEVTPEQDPVCLMIDRLIEAVALLNVEKDKDQVN